jgi:predicted Na+-dependent transporter
MTIASNPRILNSLTMAMPAMVYGVFSLITGASIAAFAARRLTSAGSS